jgi:hypothetical protein
MPLQNRVTPEGEIVAHPSRAGRLMGNRGCLHRPDRTLGTSRWKTTAWIACALSFRGRKRTVMSPGSYTELFFLDEATAYAAGHRPCAECRRADFRTFHAAWEAVFGPARAPAVDAALHTARVRRDRTKVTFEARVQALPDGTMIRAGDGPALVLEGALLPWTPEGYGLRQVLPDEPVTVLTPAPVVALFRDGLRPAMGTK